MPDEGSVKESVYDEISESTFSPYDPEAVQPTSTSPAPSTASGDVGDTSGEDGTAASRAQDPTEQPPPAFDDRYREPFVGLIYLGALTDTFTLWGHEFVIRTLTTEDIAEVGLIVREYDGTIAQNAVYQAATVAACVISVDGQPLPLPLGAEDTGLRARYNYVARNWFPPVRSMIWQKYFGLETLVNDTIDAMGKVGG